ncbi:hypothetical protein [uncultured Chitinophaga sp.]|jgi:hypothetical protein|uniref:hypothetical protein n=1 Tax=uncultured Chitinophaga sp. TaxID=339340 RepID=UPI00260AB27C|nr:hypothetical protein [uncultured Chitinophaga sp.]
MQELIQQLQEKAGLSAEQATKTIEVVKDFVKSKVPPFIGETVDKWFASAGGANQQAPEQQDDFLDN